MTRWLTQVERQVGHPHLGDLGAAQPLGEDPDECVIPDVPEGLAVPAAGRRQQVLDEVRREGGRAASRRGVPVKVVGVRMGMVVLGFQPGEQVPQVALLGVGAAPAVRGVVVAEEPVQHRGVAGGEVTLNAPGSHPRVERAGGLRVGGDGLLVERPLLLVGVRPQPLLELADHHRPQLGRRQSAIT
jgi:hypothetical protein